MDDANETKRGRVRRLLLDPLGFRHPKRVSPEEGRALLARITDELAYMSDASLSALRDMMRGKGEGSARNFWPDFASFVGFAELVQPRPITELPALLSWFRSVEGPKARDEGTLVETYDYIAARKVPPATPGARAMVAKEAAANARRLSIIAERLEAGWSVAPTELEWRRHYLGRVAEVEAIIARERGDGPAA